MSVRELLLPSILALVLGAGTAGLVACGDDGDGAGLLAPADAESILEDLSAARDALAGGECAAAEEAVTGARSAYAQLPASVDDRLKKRLREGLDALRDEIGPDCEAETLTETTPTITETVPAETETTPTETETTPTETVPTETVPPETEPVPPETEPVPPETEPDATGGISPEAAEAD